RRGGGCVGLGGDACVALHACMHTRCPPTQGDASVPTQHLDAFAIGCTYAEVPPGRRKRPHSTQHHARPYANDTFSQTASRKTYPQKMGLPPPLKLAPQ